MSSNPSFFTWHTDFPWAPRGLSVFFFFFPFPCQLAGMINLYCCFSIAFPCHWDEERQRDRLTIMRCQFSAVQLLSHVWLFVTPWTAAYQDSLSIPVHHQFPEITQTHVHRVGDAIQPSHPLSFPSPPAFNLSQPGSFQMSQFFASGGQSIGVSASASVLFQWIFRTDFF